MEIMIMPKVNTSSYKQWQTGQATIKLNRNIFTSVWLEHFTVKGDIACFHNFRVLHGRQGYDANSERQLQGGYIDWDFMRSRRRVLQAQLSQ